MNSDDSNQLPLPPAKLSPAGLVLRLGSLVVVLAGIAALFGYKAGWFTPQALTPATMINALERANGSHPGFRRNHAKGVCFTGYFESNGQGVALSKSEVFKPGRVPVLGRFALAGGLPEVADAPHTVRSLAILFQLSDGQEWRTGMNDIPVFPFNSAQGFYDQLMASVPDPATGKPDPAKMDAFRANHPETVKALGLILNYPVASGFANSTYNSLNAFRFINAAGASVPVRWTMSPLQPFVPINATNALDKNGLFDALITDIKHQPLQWHLIVMVGQPGDSTADATLPWPADRQQVEVGTLTIDHVDSEDTSTARDINFDPLILPDGIVPSDDPLLSARSAAYSESFTRREGEHKTPSAVSAAETGK